MGYGGFRVCHCSSLHRKKGCVGELEWNAARVCHEGFRLRDEDSQNRDREVRITLRELPSPHPLHTVVNFHPLPSSRWAAPADLLAAARRCTQMQFRTHKSSPSSSWQVADFTGLIYMFKPSTEGLITHEFCRSERHQAHQVPCFDCLHTAVPCRLCPSDVRQLWHAPKAHGEGSPAMPGDVCGGI